MLKPAFATILLLVVLLLASALPGSLGVVRADFVLQDTDYPGPGQPTADANNPTATSVYPGPEVPTTVPPPASPTGTGPAATSTSAATATRTASIPATTLTPSPSPLFSPTAGAGGSTQSATTSPAAGPLATLIPFPNVIIAFPSRTPPGQVSARQRLPGAQGLPKEGQIPEPKGGQGSALIVLAGLWAILGAWFYYTHRRVE